MDSQQQQQLPPPPPPPPPPLPSPGYNQQPQPGGAFHHLLQQQNQQLQMFWSYQRQEVAHGAEFKNHQLPLARIKKIMKADEDVRMISAEAPVLFAKACELFILELTIRSWLHAEENKRRTLQKNDVAAAIARTDIFDFLVDIVPRDDVKDESLGHLVAAAAAAAAAGGGVSATGVPYYYPPMGGPAAAGVMIGQPAVAAGFDPGSFVQPAPPPPPWQPVWQQGVPVEGSFGAAPGMEEQGGDAGHPLPPGSH